MTFNSQQTSQYGGQPITLFRFASDARTWLYSNQRENILRGGETYVPEAIRHSDNEQNLAEPASNIEITLPSSNLLAAEFRPYLPPKPITVQVFARHRDDPDVQYVPVFLGECAAASFNGDGTTTIACQPLTAKLKRPIPWPTYCATCNWAVFSAGCGVDKELFKTDAIADSVNGVLISASEFAPLGDHWLRAGYVVRNLTGELRWIEAHVGDTITLSAPFLGMGAGESITAFAGCDGLESTCKGKFNNLPRFAGFPDMPRKNPFTDNVFGTGQPASGAGNRPPTDTPIRTRIK